MSHPCPLSAYLFPIELPTTSSANVKPAMVRLERRIQDTKRPRRSIQEVSFALCYIGLQKNRAKQATEESFGETTFALRRS